MSERPSGSHKAAAIHDMGYQRYVGTRRPQHTRYQVIVRNLVSMSWKGWWRYKLSLGTALMITVGVAVGMYFSRLELFERSPMGGQVRTIADSLIPQSFTYLGYAALTLNLTVLAGAISRDLQAGAFEFYFSRPVRPLDYVVGKIGGAFALLAPILLVAPFLLTVYRLAMTGDVDQITDTLPWLPKALLVGTICTLAHATVALAFGAMSKSPRYAVSSYGAFILIFGGIVFGISKAVGEPWIAALNLSSAITGFASGVFDVNFLFGSESPSLAASTISLLGYITLSILFILFRVKQAQRAGMGGG
jgi:hypothetical protein